MISYHKCSDKFTWEDKFEDPFNKTLYSKTFVREKVNHFDISSTRCVDFHYWRQHSPHLTVRVNITILARNLSVRISSFLTKHFGRSLFASRVGKLVLNGLACYLINLGQAKKSDKKHQLEAQKDDYENAKLANDFRRSIVTYHCCEDRDLSKTFDN